MISLLQLATTTTAEIPTFGALGYPAWIAVTIFGLLYLFLVFEWIEKSLVTLLGAGLAIACGCISFPDAAKCVNLDVLFLLIGMMTAVSIIAETGFIEWIAILVAKKLKGNALAIMITLMALAMILSAFLPNATIVILLIPVIILIGQILEIKVAPLIILVAIASNIGGTATYVGDPPNTILGSGLNLGFMPFIYNLAPVVLVIAIAFLITIFFILRKPLNVTNDIRARIQNAYPELAIRDKKKMIWALIIFILMLVGFVSTQPIKDYFGVEIPCGIIAMFGMALMMVFCKQHSDKMYRKVEWDTILFFIGLFIVIGALEHNQVIECLAHKMNALCAGDMLFAAMLILIASAFLSAFLDNIPYIIAMTPLVQIMINEQGLSIDHPHAQALIWSLALGACLGGNGTLIGASSNIIAAKMGQNAGTPISFMHFTLWGMPLVAESIIISAIYIYFRYFVLGM